VKRKKKDKQICDVPALPLIKRLHRDERGQVVVLFVIGLMALVMLVSVVFNTGQQVSAKIKVQNAADAVVISQATSVARSLNAMAMNNVAITQSFTLNILYSTLTLNLVEASGVALFLEGKYIAQGIYWCGIAADFLGLNPVANYNCAKNIENGVHLAVYVLNPLRKIWSDLGTTLTNFKVLPPPKVRLTVEITQALEEMNKTLADDFQEVSAKWSQELGEKNGLKEPTIFVAGDAFPDGDGEYGTSLPVAKTAQSGGLPDFGDVVSGIKSGGQDLELCITGTYGTPFKFPTAYWNMQEHGYPIGTGPYKIGRDAISDKIGPINRALATRILFLPPPFSLPISSHNYKVKLDFDKWIDKLWAAGCASQTMMEGKSLTSLLDRIDLYKIKKPYIGLPLGSAIGGSGSTGLGLLGGRSDWAIIAITHQNQPKGALGGNLFTNPVGGHFAYAQAEVYNPVWYDLYTQDWKAKLVPASLLTDDDLKAKVATAVEKHYEELGQLLDKVPVAESGAYGAH